MSERNTLVRSMHDLGLAAWFGGSLMGAIGVNGAANDVDDPAERLRVASAGWQRWTPVQIAAVGTHLVGAIGMLAANRDRVAGQHGVGGNSALKAALTGLAMGVTAYSGFVGQKVWQAGEQHVEGGTQPSAYTPDDVAKNQQQLRALQWAIPAVTGALVVVSALAGEQQKPAEQSAGFARKAARRLNPVA